MERLVEGGYLPVITGAIAFVSSYAVTHFRVNHLNVELDTLKRQQTDQNARLAKLDLLEYQMGEVLKQVSKIDGIRTDVAILRGERNES